MLKSLLSARIDVHYTARSCMTTLTHSHTHTLTHPRSCQATAPLLCSSLAPSLLRPSSPSSVPSHFVPLSNKNKTFKPVKSHGASSTKRHKLSEYAKATLGSGNMRQAVVLPKGEDVNEWLAVNTVDFFNEISLLYGTITEFCLPTTCPVMCAGPHYQYLWADTTGKYKQPVKVSAPEYVDLLMSWVEAQLNDETLFPLQLGTPFPKNFQSVVKNIFKRLFRVYAHIYHSHFQKIVGLGAEAHLNTCFKHFIYFVNEFKLIDVKELEPLKDLIDSLMGKEATAQLTAAGSSGSKGQRGSGQGVGKMLDEEEKSEGDLSEGSRR